MQWFQIVDLPVKNILFGNFDQDSKKLNVLSNKTILYTLNFGSNMFKHPRKCLLPGYNGTFNLCASKLDKCNL